MGSDMNARAIMTEARATVAGARADLQRWRAERRDGGDRVVTKTVTHGRVADVAPQQTMNAHTASWVAWDARIEEKCNGVLEVVAKALDQLVDKQHDSIQEALDRRDHAIQALRDEIDIKISLGRKVARLKAEIAEARAMQPNFEGKLSGLQAEVEKLAKQTLRLRGQASQLEFGQRQLEAEQTKNRREVTLTAVKMTAFGQQTEKILRELYENGFNVVEEMQSPSGLIS